MVCIGRAVSWSRCSSPISSSLPNNPQRKLPPPNQKPGRHHIDGTRAKLKQPSILEIERAIGAGIFKDNNNTSIGGTFFDLMSESPVGKPEGEAEKKLREAGEWLIELTKESSRSGQRILLSVCLYFLPVWIFLFLIASGIIKLPFNTPLLDDWIT